MEQINLIEPLKLKIVIIGDYNVGKTSLMNQYIFNSFSDRTSQTLGADFFNKDLSIDNQKIKLQVSLIL